MDTSKLFAELMKTVNTPKTFTELMDMVYKNQRFTFDEFIKLFLGYKEIEFYYKWKRYGVTCGKSPKSDKITFDLFECDVAKHTEQSYDSLDGFISKASVRGKLLKDIWNDVKDVGFLT